MFMLIKNGRIESDEWKMLILAEGDISQSVRLPVGPVLVPLSVWLVRKAELIHREYEHGWPLGVWLAADEGPEDLVGYIDDLTVIGIQFDKFTDGKSYETSRQLREHFGYKGELRAIGDVPSDRVSYWHQIGLNSFVIHAHQKTATVISGLSDFKAVRTNRQVAASAG